MSKVLIYDLETSHNIVAQFDPKDQYTPHTNILQERFIICAAWKWLGEKKIHTVATFTNNDKVVLEVLHKVMSEADLIVAHNGDNFDKKFLETRLLVHGFPTLPPISSIDTYKIAKSKFRFNSNRLDYLGKLLGFGGKKHTPPGLWLDVLRGDKKAVKVMEDYNKRDVEVLEKVFLKLRPYMPNYVNRELFGGTGCPRCGSKKVQYRGYHRAITKTYRRLQCQSCSGWFRELKSEKGSTKFRIL